MNEQELPAAYERLHVEDTPVFLMSNLLEDQFLSPSFVDTDQAAGGIVAVTGISLEEYCGFPFEAMGWTINGSERPVLPRSTLRRPRFTRADVQRLANCRQGLVVVRGTRATADDVLSELTNLAVSRGVILEVEGFERLNDSNVVRVYWITVKPDAEAPDAARD